MTDGQFNVLIAAIISGLGALAGVIRWSVTTLTKSLDANTTAHLKSVEAMTAMGVKLDFVYQATGRVDDFIKEERSGVVEVESPPERKSQPKYRAKSEPGVR